jgi:hypothetical protein
MIPRAMRAAFAAIILASRQEKYGSERDTPSRKKRNRHHLPVAARPGLWARCGGSLVVPEMKASDAAFVLAFVALSLLVAFAVSSGTAWAPAGVSRSSASKPSLTRYHNARLRQERPS